MPSYVDEGYWEPGYAVGDVAEEPAATKAEDLMQEVLARLIALPVVPKITNIRRTRRTAVPREAGNAVHLIDERQTFKDRKNDCFRDAELNFTVRILVRSDDGLTAADPITILVMRATDSRVVPYPHSAQIIQGAMTPDVEIADLDAVAVDMQFTFKNYTVDAWGL